MVGAALKDGEQSARAKPARSPITPQALLAINILPIQIVSRAMGQRVNMGFWRFEVVSVLND